MSQCYMQVHYILDEYEYINGHLPAISVVKGKKSEKEKFTGGDYTTTFEAYVGSTGCCIQVRRCNCCAVARHLHSFTCHIYAVTYHRYHALHLIFFKFLVSVRAAIV